MQRMSPFQVHHFYWGLIIAIAGWIVMWFGHLALGFGISLLGLVIAFDDLWQEFRHLRGNLSYQSPVHRLWVWIAQKLKGGNR